MKRSNNDNQHLVSTFQSMGSRLTALARRITGSDADAEDAVQEAFCRLWSASSVPENPEAMTLTTVRNLCIDICRRRVAHPTTALDERFADSTPDPPPRDESLMAEVDTMIKKVLDGRQREILLLRDRDGWSTAEIADRYGLSEPSIRMILSRSRRAVRDAWHNRNRTP